MKKFYEVTKTETVKSTYYIEIETDEEDKFKAIESAHKEAINLIDRQDVSPHKVEKREGSFTTTVLVEGK